MKTCVNRRAIGGRRHAAHIDRAAIGADAQFHRLRAEAGAGRRHAEIDRCARQQRLPGGEVDDLAIARRLGAADADGEHRRVDRAAGLAFLRRGIAAVREDDDAGEPLVAIALGEIGQRAAEIAAARGGGEPIDVGRGRERLAEGQQLESVLGRRAAPADRGRSPGRVRDAVGPPSSVSRMLRETSTRIGSRLLFAAAGGTITTGRSRITISRISVAQRSAVSAARRPVSA